MLDDTGGDVLELGAGLGTLAADVLTELAVLDCLPQRYCILEVSADLAERQRARIARLPPELARRVEWLDRWPERPMRGVVLANEVLDAMPVSRFVLRGPPGRAARAGAGRRQRRVRASPGARPIRPPELEHAVTAVVEALARAIAGRLRFGDLPRLPALAVRAWPRSSNKAWRCSSTTACRARISITRNAVRGTLRCHFRHRAHDDPFVNVGLQDITAWVDFTRVAEGADSAGLEVLGFATQAAFLIGAGMESLLTTEMQLAERRPAAPGAAGRRGAPPDAARRNGRDLQGHRARPRLRRAAGRIQHAEPVAVTGEVTGASAISSAGSSRNSAGSSNNLSRGGRNRAIWLHEVTAVLSSHRRVRSPSPHAGSARLRVQRPASLTG